MKKRCNTCGPRIAVSPPSLGSQMQAIQEWNAQHPPGTPVIYYKLRNPLREPMETKTQEPAWLMGGHTAMVMVDGVAGGVSLENVRPR